MRSPVLVCLAALAAFPLLGGCGSGSDSVPGHTPEEEKAINAEKSMTPEEKIKQIENSPQPEGAKKEMIDRIKKENGIQ